MNQLKILSKLGKNAILSRWNKSSQASISHRFKTSTTMETKGLAAFDFDNTIVDGFSDDQLINLLPKSIILEYKDSNQWLAYMRGIFKLLQLHHINEPAIRKAITEMKPLPRMPELITELTNLNFDVIIMSDANSYSIKVWLENRGLHKYIKEVFANPAKYTDMLEAEPYHNQNWCHLSESSFCKGQVLDDYVKLQEVKNGTVYNRIVYVGDGLNDLCPMLHLSSSDIACCREGFECAKAVRMAMEGKPVQGKTCNVKAKLVFWNKGSDILNAIKSNATNNFSLKYN